MLTKVIMNWCGLGGQRLVVGWWVGGSTTDAVVRLTILILTLLLIKEDSLVTTHWLKGRIIQTFTHHDGKV